LKLIYFVLYRVLCFVFIAFVKLSRYFTIALKRKIYKIELGKAADLADSQSILRKKVSLSFDRRQVKLFIYG